MAEDPSIRDMTLPELSQVVAALAEKYRALELPTPAPKVTLEDLAQIRASLQRSIAHLDRLLVDWDQQRGRY